MTIVGTRVLSRDSNHSSPGDSNAMSAVDRLSGLAINDVRWTVLLRRFQLFFVFNGGI